MMKDTNNFLYFHDYAVDEMIYKRNYDFMSGMEGINNQFKLTAELALHEEDRRAIIMLTCELFEDDFDRKDIPYFLKMTIRGHFTCNPDVDMNDFKYNGIAILLPYLRSLITSFTAQSGINPIILPPINVYNVFEDEV